MKSNFTLLTGGKCSISLKSLTFILLLFSCFLAQAQNIGDYRSLSGGNWNDPVRWQIYTGNGSTGWENAVDYNNSYPGKTPNSNAKVTIQNCDTMIVPAGSNLSLSIGNLTINGKLYLYSNLNLETTNELLLEGGSIQWRKGYELRLPENAILIIVGPDNCPDNGAPLGLFAENSQCNNNTALYIGTVKYAACTGQGNTSAGTFEQVNNAMGSLAAFPAATPFALCEGSTQTPQLIGNAVRYGTGLGTLTYRWDYVSGPSLSFTSANTQNVNLPVLEENGVYTFKLTVTAPSFNNFSHWKEVEIEVGGTSTFTDVGGVNIWDKGIPSPENQRIAVINKFYNTAPNVQGSFEACSCTVNPGATLLISSNTYVKLEKMLINNGTVTIQSDGNLIQVEDVANTGNINVQKQLTNINNQLPANMDYIFWGSPVSGQSLTGFSSPVYAYFEYQEPTDYFIHTPDSQFQPGKGYAISAETDLANGYTQTYQFRGIPQNGTIDDYILKKSGDGQGFNMVGNPYPSNIDADLFLAQNADRIEGTLHFWTNNKPEETQQGSNYSGNNYATYNSTGGVAADSNPSNPNNNNEIPNGIIKVGQGFMVQAKSTANGLPLVFNNSMRLADAGAFFYKTSKNRFWLRLTTPDQNITTSLIGYFDEATNGYESNFDAPHSGSSEEIYSIAGTQKLLIQGKAAPFEASDVIPIGIRTFKAGTHSIDLDRIEGIFYEQAIFLKDKELNQVHNLKNGAYEFYAEKGVFDNRFELVFQDQLIEEGDQNPEPEGNNIQISKQGNFFVVNSSIDKISEVEIYNLDGRQVYKRKNINSQSHKIQSNSLEKSVLFVHVLTDKGEKVIKSIVNY